MCDVNCTLRPICVIGGIGGIRLACVIREYACACTDLCIFVIFQLFSAPSHLLFSRLQLKLFGVFHSAFFFFLTVSAFVFFSPFLVNCLTYKFLHISNTHCEQSNIPFDRLCRHDTIECNLWLEIGLCFGLNNYQIPQN